MRCRMTRRMWYIVTGVLMLKLIVEQVRLLTTEERNAQGFDCTATFMVAMGMLLCFKPQILNPRSLDVWYVATSLISNLTMLFVPPPMFDTQRFVVVYWTTTPFFCSSDETQLVFPFLHGCWHGSDAFDGRDPIPITFLCFYYHCSLCVAGIRSPCYTMVAA